METAVGERQRILPRGVSRWLGAVLVIGPGILSMAGDNDAGGLLSYVATGARFGASFFLPLLIPMALLAFSVQEMAMRLGIASGQSFSQLLRQRVDRRWTRLAALDLALTNWLSLTTEFAGMALGLAHFGIPPAIGVPASVAAVSLVVVLFRYQTAERLALALAVLSAVFVPLAIRIHPAWTSVHLWPDTIAPDWGFYALAAVGNALAPWMVFFQAKAVHDKGLRVNDLAAARWDLLIGSLLQAAVAAAVVLLAAGVPTGRLFDPQQWLRQLSARTSPLVGDLFACGIFDAGFVAAITVSLSSSWAVVETFSGRASCNLPVRQAPAFYGVYVAGLVTAGAAVLLPHLPLDFIAVAAQAAAGLLMPPILALLLLLANDRSLPRRYRNGRVANAVGFVAVAIFSLAALLLLWTGPSE